jgi:hypothetical protein
VEHFEDLMGHSNNLVHSDLGCRLSLYSGFERIRANRVLRSSGGHEEYYEAGHHQIVLLVDQNLQDQQNSKRFGLGRCQHLGATNSQTQHSGILWIGYRNRRYQGEFGALIVEEEHAQIELLTFWLY